MITMQFHIWGPMSAKLAFLCSALVFGGGAWYFDKLPRSNRPCAPGEDPITAGCWEQLEQLEDIDWDDPSFALLDANETITELRWYKGRLGHPIARFFGAHHSALIATGASGRKVRIEKFGLGTVEYCPTSRKPRCILQPGTLYKAAGGRYLNKITWGELHKSMRFDLEHYDVVDSNCHHAVQHSWNSAVVAAVRDQSPAPDDSVVAYWHDFLHWFHGTEETENLALPHNGSPVEVQVRSLSQDVDITPASSRRLDGNTLNETLDEPGSSRLDTVSFDGYNVRRRRRTKNGMAQRCRGSKPGDGDRLNNCPHRQSSLSEKGWMDGSSKKEFEFKNMRARKISFVSVMKDLDSSGMDSFFVRAVSCGTENDYSGSMHKRKQSCRPSFQSESSEESSERDILPMDPARVRSDGKGEDASSVSQCEIGHSQAERSKTDDGNVCNPLLEGATASSTSDFICQWTCDLGEIEFATESTSKFLCKEDSTDEFEIGLSAGSTVDGCLLACAVDDCATDCVKKCNYLASEAMDAGLAMCVADSSNATIGKEVTSSVRPLEKTDISATEVIGLIGWILLCCCCQCCNLMMRRKKKNEDGDLPAVGPDPTLT